MIDKEFIMLLVFTIGNGLAFYLGFKRVDYMVEYLMSILNNHRNAIEQLREEIEKLKENEKDLH